MVVRGNHAFYYIKFFAGLFNGMVPGVVDGFFCCIYVTINTVPEHLYTKHETT